MLAFLPGSTRPKYPGKGYGIERRADLDELLDCDPDDELIGALINAGGSREGRPGKRPASYTEARAFLAEHDGPEPGCGYGRKVIGELLAEADAAVPGNPTLGRHAWAVRSVTRVVELIRDGCATAADVRAIAAKLEEIKPEGGDDVLGMVAWALTNADGTRGAAAPPPRRHRHRRRQRPRAWPDPRHPQQGATPDRTLSMHVAGVAGVTTPRGVYPVGPRSPTRSTTS